MNYKSYLSICLTICLFLVAVSLIVYANEASDHYNKGNAFFAAGKYQEAIAEYQKGLELQPNQNKAQLMLNEAQVRLNGITSVNAKNIIAMDAKAPQGQTGDVRVVIDNPNSVPGVQLKLKYDNSKLEYQSHTIDALFSAWNPQVVVSPGIVSLAAASASPLSHTTEANIITITFKAIGNPSDKAPLLLEDVYLSDGDGNLLAVQTHDGEFTISVAPPTVASATPNALGQGAGNKNVVITGTNFQSGASVTFSNTGITVNSAQVDNDTQITANVSVAQDAPTGSGDITVTNPDAQSGTGTGIFTVNPAPTITYLEPESGSQGAMNLDITIKGSFFQYGASVTFSGTGITINSITFVNDTEIKINISIETTAPLGKRDVTVINPDYGVGIKADAFLIEPPTVYGDVTDDGQITAYDANVVLRTCVGLITLTPEQEKRADVSGEGGVTPLDASLILKHVVGLLTKFPVEGGAPALHPTSQVYTLAVGEVYARANEQAIIPISVDNARGILSGTLTLIYDSEYLNPIGVSTTTLTAKGRFASPLRYERTLTVHNVGDGILDISFASAKELQGKGALLLVEFEVRKASKSSISLTLLEAKLNDGQNLRKIGGYIRFVPEVTALLPNFPNPFNPDTWIPYQLDKPAKVMIRIYNLSGQLVRSLDTGHRQPGFYVDRTNAAYWNGCNESGEHVSSGVYFYTLQAGEFSAIRKLVITK